MLDLDHMDDLQQFVLGLFLTPPEERVPIWLFVSGACITGIPITQNEKDLLHIEQVQTILISKGRPMQEVEQRELQEESLHSSEPDMSYIHLKNALVIFAGGSYQSHLTVYHAHVAAWGIGSPPIK